MAQIIFEKLTVEEEKKVRAGNTLPPGLPDDGPIKPFSSCVP